MLSTQAANCQLLRLPSLDRGWTAWQRWCWLQQQTDKHPSFQLPVDRKNDWYMISIYWYICIWYRINDFKRDLKAHFFNLYFNTCFFISHALSVYVLVSWLRSVQWPEIRHRKKERKQLHQNLPFPPNRTLPLKQYQYHGRLWVVHQCAKFRRNRSNRGLDIAIFQDGGRRHLGFSKYEVFNGQNGQEGRTA